MYSSNKSSDPLWPFLVLVFDQQKYILFCSLLCARAIVKVNGTPKKEKYKKRKERKK